MAGVELWAGTTVNCLSKHFRQMARPRMQKLIQCRWPTCHSWHLIDAGPYRVHVRREKKGTHRGIAGVTWPSWIPAAVMGGEDRVKSEDPGQRKGYEA